MSFNFTYTLIGFQPYTCNRRIIDASANKKFMNSMNNFLKIFLLKSSTNYIIYIVNDSNGALRNLQVDTKIYENFLLLNGCDAVNEVTLLTL